MATRASRWAAILWAGSVLLLVPAAVWAVETQPVDPLQSENIGKDVTQGALRIVKKDGEIVECPLKHTDVEAEVAGFIARVRVTQTFYNPLDERIEAVYVFPLPHKAAVDDMTMVIGRRQIVGVIKRRAVARQIYEEAIARGATAALLEQERPNIFTQSVGNIKPGQEVKIEISYVDVLEYDMGVYEFHFPMVVGPRYIPGSPTSKIPPVPEELKGKVGELDKSKVPEGAEAPKGTGWAPDTDRVPDASRITPPVLKPGFRTGHDISLSVWVDAGVPIRDIRIPNHKAKLDREGDSELSAELEPADAIPNKDFVLKYAVVGEKPAMAVLAHTDAAGQGYFMLMVQPKEDERLKQSPPREISFLIDVSGSMSGEPTAKVIQTMREMLKRTKPADTVQVVTFANQSQKLFPQAVPCTPENISKALGFTEGLRGSGGTEMLKGIKMVLEEPLDPDRVRIVMMLTDGFIGNEAEIIAEVGRRCGDQIRFWCIGIGQSPNRFLTDGVAKQGGGMSKVIGLNDDPAEMVQEVMFRIHRAQLAKIKIDWGTLKVFETYPARIPELWAGRPVILFGLYEPGESDITLSGLAEGEPVSWPLHVKFPANAEKHDVLAKVWARQKIEELMHTTYYAGSPEVEEMVTSIALEYRLMSQYTSFVAVDESEIGRMVEPARPPRRMLVPVPIPEGTRYEGFFGDGGLGEMDTDLEPYLKLAPKPQFAGTPGPSRFSRSPGKGRMSGFFGSGGPRGAAAPPAKAAPMPSVAANKVNVNTYVAGPATALRSRPGRVAAAMELGDIAGYRGANNLWTQAMREDAAQLAQAAEARPTVAVEPGNESALLAERARLMYDYLLADMRSRMRWGGEAPARYADRIEKINKGLVRLWSKTAPALEKRLDLVLHDAAIADALEAAVARGAGLKTDGLIGGIQDPVLRAERGEMRVTYLDLRGATVAQALDWILVPERMTWWVQDGTLCAATARSAPVAGPWVYDVSLLVMPDEKEIEKIEDYQKRIQAVKQSADDFLKAVAKALGAKAIAQEREKAEEPAEKREIVWYGPGQLLLFADAKTHAAAAKLFADLADPKAELAGDLAELHKTTSARAEARKDAAEKARSAAEKVRVAGVLREYSWRLLAAAAGGELDHEALAELQVAWKNPAATQLLKGEARVIPIRSAWAFQTAMAAMPTVEESVVIPKAFRDGVQEAAKAALADLEKSPDAPAAYFAVLYTALGIRDPSSEFLAKAKPLLTEGKADSPLADVRTVAKALLAEPKDVDAKALAELVAKGVRGDDMVALTALACRRAGGEAWTAFRAESRAILGDQPLSGAVVVLVNRLSRPGMILAAR
ncbi:MAG: VIT domain-containing protein [Phycisphaerae bacterium]